MPQTSYTQPNNVLFDERSVMMEENLSEKILKRSRKCDEYFDESDQEVTAYRPTVSEDSRERDDQVRSVRSRSDCHCSVHPMQACTLIPEERYSASDLLEHPWLESAYSTC